MRQRGNSDAARADHHFHTSHHLRSAFYSQLGIQSTTATLKKSVQLYFERDEWDSQELRRICCQGHLQSPATYRSRVWKVLLGLMPRYGESLELVEAQQSAQYEDIHTLLPLFKERSHRVVLDEAFSSTADLNSLHQVANDVAHSYLLYARIEKFSNCDNRQRVPTGNALYYLSYAFGSVFPGDAAGAFWCLCTFLSSPNRRTAIDLGPPGVLLPSAVIARTDKTLHDALQDYSKGVDNVFDMNWFLEGVVPVAPLSLLCQLVDRMILLPGAYLAIFGAFVLIARRADLLQKEGTASPSPPTSPLSRSDPPVPADSPPSVPRSPGKDSDLMSFSDPSALFIPSKDTRQSDFPSISARVEATLTRPFLAPGDMDPVIKSCDQFIIALLK